MSSDGDCDCPCHRDVVESKPYGEESGMCWTYPKENGRQVERKRKARNWQMGRQLVGVTVLLTTSLTLSSDTMERFSAKSRVTYLAWRKLLKLHVFRTTMPQLKTLHFMTSPEGPDSWCKWQCDQANGTNTLSPKNVAHAVMQEILTKFEVLWNRNLLRSAWKASRRTEQQ